MGSMLGLLHICWNRYAVFVSMVRVCVYVLLFVLVSCKSDAPTSFEAHQIQDSSPHAYIQGLDSIRKQGILNAIVEAGPHAYYLHKGYPSGYTYEMLKSFADYLEVDLNIVVSHSLTESFALLSEGKGAFLAESLAITSQRKKEWLFGPVLMQTQQILVQRLPKGWYNIVTSDELNNYLVNNISELKGKTIYVPKASVYLDRLQHIVDDTGNHIRIVDTVLSIDRLVALVAKDSIDYTICDEHVAFYNKVIYNNLDINTKIGNYRQRIAWALPKGADSLQLEMQKWLRHIKKNKSFYYIYNKYYDNPYYAQQVKKELQKEILNTYLCPYDSLIQKYSQLLGWDWRLVASVICQESGFKNKKNPVSGAFGVMQMMPETAKIYHLDSASSIEDQVKAGISYLKLLDKEISDKVMDSAQRQKFVLAAYNVGTGHVFDAMRLATKYGKNPQIWYHNVEDYMLLLSEADYYADSLCFYGYCRGAEPYNYVREIEDRYHDYSNLLKANENTQ